MAQGTHAPFFFRNHRAGRRRRERGTIYIETLLALLPLLFAFLGVVQLSLLWVGGLVVQYAANRAVRAAVVVLDEDPQRYRGAPRGNLSAGASSNGISRFATGATRIYSRLLGQDSVEEGARLSEIRRAAYLPLAVLAPPASSSQTLGEEIAGDATSRFLLGASLSIPSVTAVTVRNSDGPVSTVGPKDPVTVRVAHLMNCGVPLVRKFICHQAKSLASAPLRSRIDEIGLEGERLGRLRRSRDEPAGASDRELEIMEEMMNVSSPLARDAALALGGSRTLITAEASLPNQGATYHGKVQ